MNPLRLDMPRCRRCGAPGRFRYIKKLTGGYHEVVCTGCDHSDAAYSAVDAANDFSPPQRRWKKAHALIELDGQQRIRGLSPAPAAGVPSLQKPKPWKGMEPRIEFWPVALR